MTTNQGVGSSNLSWVTMKSAKQQFSGFFIARKRAWDTPLVRGLTGFQPEGCCGGFAADFKKRGRGSAAGCVEGLCSLRSGGDSPAGLRVVDCPSGNAYKVSVTGFTFGIIWRNKHYNDQPPPVAFPPLVPYGTTFPPRSGGTIKLRKAILS